LNRFQETELVLSERKQALKSLALIRQLLRRSQLPAEVPC